MTSQPDEPDVRISVTGAPDPDADLHVQLTQGRPQVHRTKQESKDNSRLVWSALMMLLAFGIATSFNILYTQHAIRQADSRWCVLIGGLDDRYANSIPKGSEEFAAQIHRLRIGLHCPTKTGAANEPPPGSGEPDGLGD